MNANTECNLETFFKDFVQMNCIINFSTNKMAAGKTKSAQCIVVDNVPLKLERAECQFKSYTQQDKSEDRQSF